MNLKKVVRDVKALRKSLQAAGRPDSVAGVDSVLDLLARGHGYELDGYDSLDGPTEGWLRLPHLPALIVHPEADFLTLVAALEPEEVDYWQAQGRLTHAAFADGAWAIIALQKLDGQWQLNPFCAVLATRLDGGLVLETPALLPEIGQFVVQEMDCPAEQITAVVANDMARHFSAVITLSGLSLDTPHYLH